MKFVSIIATFFAASTAFACPDLSGTYVCQGQNGLENLTIEQEVVNQMTIYTLTDSQGTQQLPTDNVVYPVEDAASNLTGSARFACEGDTFNSYLKGSVTAADKKTVVESWDVVQSLKLDESKNLITSLTGTVLQNGTTHPLNSSGTCARK
jgi:hypothetical protein